VLLLVVLRLMLKLRRRVEVLLLRRNEPVGEVGIVSKGLSWERRNEVAVGLRVAIRNLMWHGKRVSSSSGGEHVEGVR